MKRLTYLFVLLAACTGQQKEGGQAAPDRIEEHVQNIEIIRDSFGVAHVYGKTDADAVFGMIYAQCEDDFNRVEMNYINAMGRLAEVEGKGELFRDLRMKLFIDPVEIQELYFGSPEWLKTLLVAWADGINHYLATHPERSPKLITQWEPWMALCFSEGSIGGDIERGISVNRLREFYQKMAGIAMDKATAYGPVYGDGINDPMNLEPRGSNGISIAPKLTENGNSLFLINPHTSFFFRSELHMVSEEGLNAYGATTWGQFFIYQGFNERLGWMHTSTYADVLDEYRESIFDTELGYYYQHGEEKRPIDTKEITLRYKAEDGTMKDTTVMGYYTHHGPAVRADENGNWITMALMHRPVDALKQSFGRTKAQNWDEFYEAMSIRTNSSNNTVYADADGNIAYFHGNYLMKRDDSFDWSQPVDGSDPATDYQGMHSMEEMMIIKNPENGWLQNCNSTPFTAAGEYSPSPEDFPAYMVPDRENYRGIHAVQVLEGKTGWTLDKLRQAAYDPYMPGFAHMLPGLISAMEADRLSVPDPELYQQLKDWDFKWSAESVETTLAHFWATEMVRLVRASGAETPEGVYPYIATEAPDAMRLAALSNVVNTLTEDFGSWQVPFGEVNRYQRINGEIVQPFNDEAPSIPVKFASGRWGSLAAYGARKYPGTKRMYGTRGNSFVAFVEFGDRLKAMSISTGGGSDNPQSNHFDDQAEKYANADFKQVRFYREDVESDAEKAYHPGE
ncbi:MAG: penicillin acylase family protein [Bacteroidota bacterium]